MFTKLERSLIIIVVILILLLIGLGIIFFKDNYTKKELKKDLDNALNDLKTLNNDINTGKTNLDKNYYSNINEINDFLGSNKHFSTNFFSSSNNNLIYIGTNVYGVDIHDSQTIAEKDAIIQSLIAINNKLSDALEQERAERDKLLLQLSEKTSTISTNISNIKDKVNKLEVTKTISWAVGLNASWDGLINNEIAYSVHIHGLMFVKNKFYVGVELGVAKQITLNPSLGVLVGYKIN